MEGDVVDLLVVGEHEVDVGRAAHLALALDDAAKAAARDVALVVHGDVHELDDVEENLVVGVVDGAISPGNGMRPGRC